MYGKWFASTYTGSMMAAGSDVFAVWGYVVANTVQSRVELNPRLLAALIGTSEDAVHRAIQYLCQPDPSSRSKDQEGRRIIPESGYQYFVVNHLHYRGLINEDSRREYFKIKKREQRQRHKKKKKSNGMSKTCPGQSETVNDSPGQSSVSTQAEAEAKAEATENPPLPPSGGASEQPARATRKRAPAPKPDKPPFDPKTLPGLNLEAFAKWVEYRRQRRPPIKEYSMEGAARKLLSFGTVDEQMAVVLNSIADQYQGLVAPKTFSARGLAQPVLTHEQREGIELEKLRARRKAMPLLANFRDPLPGESSKDYRKAQDTEFERGQEELSRKNAPLLKDLGERIRNIGKTGALT